MLDRLFQPQWAGGWAATRLLFAVTALLTHAPRALHFPDAYTATDMVFTRGPYRLAEHMLMTPTWAWTFWALGVLGLIGVARGRRTFHLGLILWLIGSWALLGYEALNVKAYDRLLSWIAMGLFLSPAAEPGLTSKWRSPTARWFLLLSYCALYGSTGWLKLLEEPGWWSGEVLANHLLHPWFGNRPLGIWLSDKQAVMAFMGSATVIVEASFPLLIWFRRTNPFALLGCFFLHAGILLLMNVGTFSIVAVSAYPVLLHPEIARGWHARFQGWRARRGAS